MSAPALVVLAAGAARRLGTCKALARLRDEEPGTPLALLLAAWSEAQGTGPHPPLVITGAHDAEIRAAWDGGGVELLHNPAWERGRSGGVLLARDRRPDRDLCLAPVDVPLVTAATFTALLAAWGRAGEPARGWLAPRATVSDGAHGAPRYGHPVVVGRELLSTWSPDPDTPLSSLRALADPLLGTDVDDPGILEDLDTPADLESLRRRLALS